MSLADLLSEPPARYRKGPRCTTGMLLEDLEVSDPAAAAALRAQLANQRMPGPELERRLESVGIYIKARTLAYHRRGDCQCPK